MSFNNYLKSDILLKKEKLKDITKYLKHYGVNVKDLSKKVEDVLNLQYKKIDYLNKKANQTIDENITKQFKYNMDIEQ